MPRNVKSGLIQLSLPMTEGEGSISEIMQAMEDKHIPYIEEAGKKGVQILCLQEIFNTPYFCPGQDKDWYASAMPLHSPMMARMQELAKKYDMAMVVPFYEKEQAGFLYNTAAVIDADGSILGKIILQAGQLGLSGIPDKICQSGCVHLLRSTLPRWGKSARIEWSRNRI